MSSTNVNHTEIRDFSNENQHSRLLRFFTLSSLVSMIIILTLVGSSIHFLFAHFLLREAESDAVTIGLALLEQEKETFINEDDTQRKYIKIDKEEYSSFDQRVRKSLDIFRLVKLKIYSPEGIIIYSTDPEIVGRSDTKNKDLISALNGNVSSKLESENEVWDLTDEEKIGSEMVETYLPIKDQNNDIVGVFEIYMDVSTYRSEVRYVLGIILGILLLILILVFGLLRIFMNQAIKTIYTKNQDIRVLKGLLPICSFCKKIRNDLGDWEVLEQYISDRSESQFSHSLCPECKLENYPDL